MIPRRIPLRAGGRIARALAAFAADERGASVAEYALTLIVLAGCTAVIFHSLGSKSAAVMNHIASAMR
jgi:Flp pilus assembly pilin Flp